MTQRRPNSCWPKPVFPNGLDAGELVPIPPFTDVSEAVVNYLKAVVSASGCVPWNARLPVGLAREEAAWLFMTAVGASGNAATRAEAFMYSKARMLTGVLLTSTSFPAAGGERDRTKREPSCTDPTGSPRAGDVCPDHGPCAGSRAWATPG